MMQTMDNETETSVFELAASFLQEGVYASREQAHAPEARSLTASESAAGSCGLGARPLTHPTWSSRQTRCAEELGRALNLETSGKASDGTKLLVEHLASWVRVQDGLDRKRNHFLKDFRAQYGADRRSYSPETDARFREGLAAINADNQERLRAAAAAVIEGLKALKTFKA